MLPLLRRLLGRRCGCCSFLVLLGCLLFDRLQELGIFPQIPCHQQAVRHVMAAFFGGITCGHQCWRNAIVNRQLPRPVCEIVASGKLCNPSLVPRLFAQHLLGKPHGTLLAVVS